MNPVPERQHFDEALLTMDRASVRRIAQQTLASLHPLATIESLVVPALERLGDGWERGTYSLSQVYMAGRLCEELVDDLLPPASPDRIRQPRMAMVVLEDYHMLGKRIVRSTVRAAGYELADCGRMDVDTVVSRVVLDRVEVLLTSTLMLNSALRVGVLCDRLRVEAPETKVIVGGAPFRLDPMLWREVGAFATSQTASGILPVIRQLCERGQG